MAKTPDYRSDLDLYVASESGEVVPFTTIWYDAANKIGILEPVGTHYAYRRMGLARAVIGEGARRIADEGGLGLYVGSNKPFYLSIGFDVCLRNEIWKKELPAGIRGH